MALCDILVPTLLDRLLLELLDHLDLGDAKRPVWLLFGLGEVDWAVGLLFDDVVGVKGETQGQKAHKAKNLEIGRICKKK